MPGMNGLKELREQGRMTWIEQEYGWLAAPEEIFKALSIGDLGESPGVASSHRVHRYRWGVTCGCSCLERGWRSRIGGWCLIIGIT